MRIALLCNDRIALPALDYLLSTGELVAAGMPVRLSETQPVVRERCRREQIPFRTFEKKHFEAAIHDWLQQCLPDVVLVKTFPWLIPASVLQLPRHGFINFHYAPLPAWRGSNPLFWMLRNQATMAGVTVHEMTTAYDEGPILLQHSIPIGRNINFGILYTQLAYVGVQLTAQLLTGLQSGTLEKKEQDAAAAAWYSHPQPADLYIKWQSMDAEEINALVKACNPWNKGAAARWKNWTFGITYASVLEDVPQKLAPGTILSIDSVAGFTIACKDGKALLAEVVYCEEGFYPGYCLSAFGLKQMDRLS